MKADYDLIADQWCLLRQTLPPKDSHLLYDFINRLPDKARILDLGCGSGIPIAKLLSEKDLSIVGVDRSISLLQRARENVPSGLFEKAEIEEYEIKGEYSGVVLWDSLFHIPRAHHDFILWKIYNALTAGGLLLLSSGGSDEDLPPFSDFMFGVEFFYDSLTPVTLFQLCDSIGFTVVTQSMVNQPDGHSDKGRIGAILLKN